MVIKNYTGDVMNFEMARDMAEADGIKVAQVISNDDVAVKDSLYTVGRRGVAGTILSIRSQARKQKQAERSRKCRQRHRRSSITCARWALPFVRARFRRPETWV